MYRTLKLRSTLLKVVTALIIAFTSSNAVAQTTLTISGTVTDNDNEPLIGATVMVKNTTVGVATDIDGHYVLNAPSDAILVVSYIGYNPISEAVNGRTNINFVLSSSSESLDEVVVVGYGVQRRGSITGAVSELKGDAMVKTNNENPQNMLTGKIPGVRVWQKSSEPGTYNNNFDIRGMGSPLVVIDGVPRTVEDFQRLNANDIQDVSVLKDAAAAIYGVRAANGVLLVTTKQGTSGTAKVSYNGSFTIQKPKSMPQLANAFDAMTIWNERGRNNINGGQLYYTESDFEAFASGLRQQTDWNGEVIASWSPQTQHDVSVSGGNDRTRYFASLGYLYQEGMFKSGDLNYDKLNLRSNLSTTIWNGIKLDLNISAMSDTRNTPYYGSVDIIRNYWSQGVLHPAYADPERTMLNYAGLDLERNTVAMMTSDISGHRKYRRKMFQSSAALNIDFGAYTSALKGLSAKGLVSYDYTVDNNEIFKKEFTQYAYNEADGSYTSKVFSETSPSNMRREFYDKSQFMLQFTLNYLRTFADMHNVGAVVGYESTSRHGDNFYAYRDLAFTVPYLLAGVEEGQVGSMNTDLGSLYDFGNRAVIARVTYDYDNRYLIEGQFRYDGSSKFAKGHRWGFFPSVSAGWRIAEEPWFRESIDPNGFVSQLKLRASYGVLGDDGSINYEWLQGFTYRGGTAADNGNYNGYSPGYIFDGDFIYGASPSGIPNVLLSWYKSKTFNIGVDFESRNGLIGATVDYFVRNRSGLFERRGGDLPTVVGATAPLENVNSDRHYGLEVALTHRYNVGDWSWSARGIFSITRNKYLTAVQNGPYANSYDKWRHDNLNNRFQGVQFGYEGNGRYHNWYEIWNDPLYTERDLLPGDYKYLDWNGDGEINGEDEHPYAFDQTPWMNFSLDVNVLWKGFDFNMLWQGSALGSMSYQEPLFSVWGQNGGGVLEQFTDRWHTTDPNADIYDPATEWVSGYYAFGQRTPRSNSTFNRVSTDYLRLKSVELGYTIPEKLLRGNKIRVYFNCYNPVTFTKVKFVDPEHPDSDNGRLYPLNRTYTVGLNLSF
ncbi:MAG: TonB-dependent receptor [Muribaculaceae bacterium]|nr:TonB-dependent receptor [Muribaculaceae bacterium]